ncbi:MAG: response regulator transcription factor [Clostridiales bacterium]|jgi:two-component system response regulator ResD|nr:response regulator transcription factor [Clostridiales bacterium]
MDSIRLLVVDIDKNIRSAISSKIMAKGYLCDEAADGIAALKLFRRNDYNLVILDARLPELNGKIVCRQIRKVSDIPLIIIGEDGSEEDIVSFYETGADDYLPKPVSVPILMRKAEVLLRRCGELERRGPRKISFGGLYINTVSRAVYVDDRQVNLTPKEYALLSFLSQNPNKAFSRDMLLNEVWGIDYDGMDRTVDSHIKTLRVNIHPYENYIETVWGFGYKFNAGA